LFFLAKDDHDRLVTFSAREICGENDIALSTKAQVDRSGYIRSFALGVCRRYQPSGDKYQHL
jgi:hypothetical protein